MTTKIYNYEYNEWEYICVTFQLYFKPSSTRNINNNILFNFIITFFQRARMSACRVESRETLKRYWYKNWHDHYQIIGRKWGLDEIGGE